MQAKHIIEMRKKSFFLSAIVIGLIGCTTKTSLKTGDLLFQAAKDSEMAGAIEAATGKKATINYTHVGIAIAGNGADSVLEATSGGVRMVCLADFLTEAGTIGGRPAVIAMRLRDTTGVSASVAAARKLIGCPYDYSFRTGNDKYYCSELVWETFRRPDGERIFPAQPMNFRAADGSMPAYWTGLFERLGEPIPEGEPGTNPNDMARDAQLVEIGRYF